MNSTGVVSDSFDDQAAVFDQRAGLPNEHCRDIADTVLALAKVSADDLLVEIGPGTGQIGQWFGGRINYLGLDNSVEMLKQFQNRLSGLEVNQALIQGDANASWPLADGAARVIFSSRAMHRFDREHAASEVFRISSRAGATLILGRVERDPESVRSRLSKEMNDRLRRHGFEGHRGEKGVKRFIESCCERGAEALQPVSVAEWKTLATPRQSLDSWRRVGGLGGARISADTKEQILKELELWAASEFEGLDQHFESNETYVLMPVGIPPVRHG